MKTYEIEFYEDEHGHCPVAEWLKDLDINNGIKENRSMLRKVYYQIERLEYEGTRVGEPICKQVEGSIWEIRPIPNRVFIGIADKSKIILLHHYRKKTNKTPRLEIEKAKREFADWQCRQR